MKTKDGFYPQVGGDLYQPEIIDRFTDVYVGMLRVKVVSAEDSGIFYYTRYSGDKPGKEKFEGSVSGWFLHRENAVKEAVVIMDRLSEDYIKDKQILDSKLEHISKMKAELGAVQPKYIHDCSECIFIGQFVDKESVTWDYYWCPQQGIPTVVMRWGDGVAEYCSGPYDCLNTNGYLDYYDAAWEAYLRWSRNNVEIIEAVVERCKHER